METVEYAAGRRADLFGQPEKTAILLWHGAQPNARASVRPLAELLAGHHELGVVVPDWNPRADDGGRSDLLGSVAYTKTWAAHPGNSVIVGWSLGAAAAAALAIRGQQYLPVAHAVCLGGAFMVADPIFGEPLRAEAPDGDRRPPFTLLHGKRDDVVPVAASRGFAYALESVGWPVTLEELNTDHAAIAGAVYDPGADKYLPAEDEESLAVATEVAARIAAAIAPKSATG
jgi:dienelactone hydrolase